MFGLANRSCVLKTIHSAIIAIIILETHIPYAAPSRPRPRKTIKNGSINTAITPGIIVTSIAPTPSPSARKIALPDIPNAITGKDGRENKR